MLAGYRRTAADRGRGHAGPFSASDLAAVLATCHRSRRRGRGIESEEVAAERGRVDAVIAGLLFMAGMRLREVSALRWSDVVDATDGDGVVIRVRISKTNQEGEVNDVRFVKDGVARALRTLRAATSPEPAGRVRVIREWAYDASSLSLGRAFLCGDSACFIDPLFSQGVHLATYSAMLAAAGIDHLYRHPQDADEIHRWYEASYREAYNRYHEFLAAFYSANSALDSTFWRNRKITGAEDSRFAGKDWFTALSGQQVEAGAQGVDELETRAATLADLWQHNRNEVTDQFDGTELSLRRLRWAGQLMQEFRRMARITWVSDEVRLVPSFKVHPTTFALERQHFIGDEYGRTMTTYALSEDHRRLFESLKSDPLSYRELAGRLKELKGQGTPVQVIGRLTENGFLQGFDENGDPVKIQAALRFGGVGAEDDIS